MHRLCVLVSGNGTTLQAIIDSIDRGELEASIAAVISSRPDAYALTRASRHGIEAIALDFRKSGQKQYDEMLYERLVVLSPDLICLAGYLRILDARTVRHFIGRIVNTHPALLPSFGGRGMYGDRVHDAVLKSGAQKSGCSVHFVTEGIDTGPVILQASVPVKKGDTVRDLADRVHDVELKAYPEAIRLVLEGKAVFSGA